MKKLKRLATGMSYSEVRERQTANERAEREALLPAQVEKAEPADLQDDEPVVDDALSTETTGEVDTPPESVEPAPLPAVTSTALAEKETQLVPSVDDTNDRDEVPDRDASIRKLPHVKPGNDRIVKPEARRSSEPAPSTSVTAPEQTTIVKGSVARPAYGVSKTYDKVAERYGDKVAMQHLLDTSIQALRKALEAGNTISMEVEPTYSAHAKKIQPKRTLPCAVYDMVRQEIDPLGILKQGTISTTIMQGALNYFIASDKDVV